MKNDALKQQGQSASIQRLSTLLKEVKPPLKNENEWAVLESNLFATLQKPRTFHEQYQASFFHNFFNPVIIAPAAAILFIVVAVLFYRFNNSQPDPFARVVSIRGIVLAIAAGENKVDTLTGIGSFARIPDFGKKFAFRTLENSSLIMQLDHGSVFELFQNSIVSIKEINRRHLFFDLDKGSMLVKVSKRLKNQKFIITTPGASCSVAGTIFKVDVRNEVNATSAQTVLTVYEGKVKFTTGGQLMYVASGQTCRADKNGFGTINAISELETPIKNISALELLVSHENPSGVKYGLIDVTTQPEQALVIIDDSLTGKAPLLARKTIGRHSVVMSAHGYETLEKTVEIGKDSISRISTRLEKNAAFGKITLHPTKQPSCPFPAVLQPESTLVAVPEYVEAMVQLTIGEYQKAVGILDSLKNNQPIDMKSRMSIMKKINGCYAKLGDFKNALERLEEKYEKSSSNTDKENLLWEMANIKANCMGDYQGAEMALVELLVIAPAGIRAHDAYGKLAEVQYMLNKSESAAATYREHIKKFPDDPDIDKSLFSLANILDNDTHNYKEALVLYTKLIKTYPRAGYIEASLFARAECLIKLGKIVEAQNDLKKCLEKAPEGMWSPVCVQLMKELR
ncbi:MAG: FecR domain-containing protein [Chitinivibrionales bacterium]